MDNFKPNEQKMVGLDLSSIESNSNKSKMKNDIPGKRVEKVSSGKKAKESKSELAKAFEFFAGETIDEIKNYIIEDVILPNVKDTLLDIVGGILGSKGKKSASLRVPYSSISSNQTVVTRNSLTTSRSSDFEIITFDSRKEASDVLDTLCDLIRRYGTARVGDFYDAAGLYPDANSYNFGWKNLDNAVVRSDHTGGFYIDLPRPSVV